jgi:hypothetical protein
VKRAQISDRCGPRMLTENSPRRWIAVPAVLPLLVPRQQHARGGSDTGVSELIVAPNSSPSDLVATTATPVANVPIRERKRLGSTLPVIGYFRSTCRGTQGGGRMIEGASIRQISGFPSSWEASDFKILRGLNPLDAASLECCTAYIAVRGAYE